MAMYHDKGNTDRAIADSARSDQHRSNYVAACPVIGDNFKSLFRRCS